MGQKTLWPYLRKLQRGDNSMIQKTLILRNISKTFVSVLIPCFLTFLVIGCASGPIAYRMVNEDNTNIENLEKSKLGMTKAEVLTLMGTEDKSEKFERKGVAVEILYYHTSGSYSPDAGWQNMDSTPVVFEAGILKGWGKYYDDQRLGRPRMSKDQ
jgi:hypothetical protein